jgi:hypothetical protein
MWNGWLAAFCLIQTLSTIKNASGQEHYSSVGNVVCRMKQRIANDRSLRRTVETIERSEWREDPAS